MYYNLFNGSHKQKLVVLIDFNDVFVMTAVSLMHLSSRTCRKIAIYSHNGAVKSNDKYLNTSGFYHPTLSISSGIANKNKHRMVFLSGAMGGNDATFVSEFGVRQGVA